MRRALLYINGEPTKTSRTLGHVLVNGLAALGLTMGLVGLTLFVLLWFRLINW